MRVERVHESSKRKREFELSSSYGPGLRLHSPLHVRYSDVQREVVAHALLSVDTFVPALRHLVRVLVLVFGKIQIRILVSKNRFCVSLPISENGLISDQ